MVGGVVVGGVEGVAVVVPMAVVILDPEATVEALPEAGFIFLHITDQLPLIGGKEPSRLRLS